jgi:hypothetical protein
MKKVKLATIILAALLLISCQDAGTLEQIDEGSNQDIEVFRYYYAKGSYVYVARFKNCPNVVSTTWSESSGKGSVTKGNVSIFENEIKNK